MYVSLRCICLSHVVRFYQDRQEKLRFCVLTKSSLWMYAVSFNSILATDVMQEAMRGFLDQKGVRAMNGYYPEPPQEDIVEAYEEHGLMGPNPDAPRVCLMENLGGKWNKAVLEMLTTAFISAVKQGNYKPVEHTWPQMQEEVVRKRCQIKLYSTQRMCITHKHHKGPALDKLS